MAQTFSLSGTVSWNDTLDLDVTNPNEDMILCEVMKHDGVPQQVTTQLVNTEISNFQL